MGFAVDEDGGDVAAQEGHGDDVGAEGGGLRLRHANLQSVVDGWLAPVLFLQVGALRLPSPGP
ncbi:hypothetical protein GCM10010468_49800 [Actinocorallia longicatena]|uniref:Uncharacterized protein n=1 Tax=Actinocorallia longicatena TaxID=111803 RepID=A0ABP6QF99_9ACTN